MILKTNYYHKIISVWAVWKPGKRNDGFEIYDEFKPVGGELIFDKNVNSPFKGTGLLEYLSKKEEDTIIVVGLQTDYCIDATVKCGFEHVFKMIVPEHTNSTFGNDFMNAECLSFEKTLELINSYFRWGKEHEDLIFLKQKKAETL